jgi:undecaprenyl-diphosphatase
VSANSDVKDVAAREPLSWLRRLQSNLTIGLTTLVRPPREGYPRASWRAPARLAIGALIALVLLIACMVLLDAWTLRYTPHLPPWIIDSFNRLTDFGNSGVFLWPAGCGLALIAALSGPRLPRFTRLVMAALAVRLGFIVVAIGLPGLFTTIAKRLIGRARPLTESEVDPFLFSPFDWQHGYASLPSGHATTAFAALIAIGALWPRLRPLMWIYALVIASSRILISVHYPSDVIAAALIGAVGALIVRDWYAARRLGFVFDADGRIRSLPGPSFARVKRVVEQLSVPYVARASH